MINPLLPTDTAVRQQYFMFVALSPRALDQRFDLAAHVIAGVFGDEFQEFHADEIFPRPAKIPAVGVVYKSQSSVRQVAADQLGLALHHAAIPRLALAQSL